MSRSSALVHDPGTVALPRARSRWFHGTSLAAGERILKEGRIAPPPVLAAHYEGRKWVAPVEGRVYVTNDIELGLTYAHLRAYKGRGKYGPGALIEVELEEPCYPDEDEVGRALEFVLYDEPDHLWKEGALEGSYAAISAMGHAVLAAAPRALARRWKKTPQRDIGGWSAARKAKEGKAALALLPPQVVDELAAMTRSIGCRGARALRGWVVPADYWKRRNELSDETRSQIKEGDVAAGRVASHEAARRLAHEWLLAELPEMAPPRAENPTLPRSSAAFQRLSDETHRFSERTRQELGLETFDVGLSGDGFLILFLLVVPRGERGRGRGTEAMRRLLRYADEHRLRIVLTLGSRDPIRGTTSRARLVGFYKRFGFYENKGRKRDWEISYDMIREPAAPARRDNPASGNIFLGRRFASPEERARYEADPSLAAKLASRSRPAKKKKPTPAAITLAGYALEADATRQEKRQIMLSRAAWDRAAALLETLGGRVKVDEVHDADGLDGEATAYVPVRRLETALKRLDRASVLYETIDVPSGGPHGIEERLRHRYPPSSGVWVNAAGGPRACLVCRGIPEARERGYDPRRGCFCPPPVSPRQRSSWETRD